MEQLLIFKTNDNSMVFTKESLNLHVFNTTCELSTRNVTKMIAENISCINLGFNEVHDLKEDVKSFIRRLYEMGAVKYLNHENVMRLSHMIKDLHLKKSDIFEELV